MILVDTSIWIDFLGPRPGAPAARLDEIVESNIAFTLTPIIFQEILQGARSVSQFSRLRKNLMTQRFIFPRDEIDSFGAAGAIYARCRWAGFTPRSTIDCLIVQIAIENRAPLLHNDADFDRIAKVIPELTIY